jgi:hypothetical protein
LTKYCDYFATRLHGYRNIMKKVNVTGNEPIAIPALVDTSEIANLSTIKQ